MTRNSKRAAIVLFFVLLLSAIGISIAQAHTPNGGATCDGYFVTATNYEARDTNIISSTFDGVTTSRQFATHDSITGSWPQDGVPHTWSGYVHTSNRNAAYSHDYGPITLTCGPPPPVEQHQYMQTSTTPTCKNRTVTTTYYERDETFTWDGQEYVGTWSDWYVINQTTKTVHVKNCVVKRHAHVRVHITDKCNCFMDKVVMHHGQNVLVQAHHPSRLTWKFKVTGKRVGNKQYLLPNHMNGSHGWAKVQWYTVHTTNVPCPCHITHTCHHSGPPHHHCPTAAVAGKLNEACH